MKEKKKRVSRWWRTTTVLTLGVVIGTVLMATPAGSHIGTVAHLWRAHIRPKADARYDRPTVKRLETIRGTVGGQVISGATGEWGFNAQLPRASRAGLDDAHVTIDGVDEASGECTGTAANPTAAPGYVCIYPYSVSGMSPFVGGAIWGSGDGTNWGFQVSINATTTGPVWWFANWAYKGTNAAIAPRQVLRAADRGCSTKGGGGC